MSIKLSGECHCGNISLDLHTEKGESDFVPRECSCTLCRKHRASWVSDPEGTLHLHYKNKDLVSSYRFGHKTSDFIVCARCGVLMVALCELEGRTRAVIYIRSMPEVTFAAQPITTNFDGKDIPVRLARRGRNWTGNVMFD